MSEQDALASYRAEVVAATSPEELDAAYERERSRRESNVSDDETPEQSYEARIAALEAQLAASQRKAAGAPLPLVPANGGGPGNDNHQSSWGLAQQEMASRGEWLEEWGDRPE